jgi:hypothetical protein
MADALDLDDPNVLNYWGAPPAQATPGAIDLDAVPAHYGGSPLSRGEIPGAITYSEKAAIPGAIQYAPEAKIPGAIPYTAPPQPPAMPAPAPPPAAPSGPTPADDAAFNARMAQVTAPKPAPMGAGAGAAVNPYKGVNAEILGSMAAQRDAGVSAANVEADRIRQIGEGKSAIAKQQELDAQLAQLEGDEASKRFDSHMQQMQQQLDDVRSKKVDPKKYMNDRGMLGAFGAVLGGVIGGVYQGLANLQKNPFLEDLNAEIDRQMAADDKNIANEKQAVGEQMNLLAMNRAAFKDNQLAKMQTRNMYLEAARTQLEADMAGADSELAKSRAQQGIEGVNLLIAQQKKAFLVEAQKQAAAGAGAMYARQKERAATFKETYKEALGQGMSPAQAEHAALRVTAHLYAPQELERLGPVPSGGEYDGMTVRDRSHLKREKTAAQEEAAAEIEALRVFKQRIPELSAGSAVGDYWSGAPGFLPGVSTAKANKLSRESYNATVARAYDAAMKSAQGSAPTESQKAQLKVFYLENNDGDEDVARKINAAEEFVIQAARSKGLQESTPRETAKALGEKPLK